MKYQHFVKFVELTVAHLRSSVSSPYSSRSSSEMERGLTTLVSLDSGPRTIEAKGGVQTQLRGQGPLKESRRTMPQDTTSSPSYGHRRSAQRPEEAGKVPDTKAEHEPLGRKLDEEYYPSPAVTRYCLPPAPTPAGGYYPPSAATPVGGNELPETRFFDINSGMGIVNNSNNVPIMGGTNAQSLQSQKALLGEVFNQVMREN